MFDMVEMRLCCLNPQVMEVHLLEYFSISNLGVQ